LKQSISADLFETEPATATPARIFTIRLLVNLLGDAHVSPNYFLALRQIWKRNDIWIFPER